MMFMVVMHGAVWRSVKAAPATSVDAYAHARVHYRVLMGSPEKQRFRHHWLKVIEAFKKVHETYPKSAEAPRAAFTVAELWRGLYDISRASGDRDQALEAYTRVAPAYATASIEPQQLADDAQWMRAQLFLRKGDRLSAARALDKLLRRYPMGDMVAKAKVEAAGLKKEMAMIHQRTKSGHVVLDPGHGGTDSGAIGVKGIKEKDVVLGIALQVAKRLRNRGIKTTLTRSDDTFLTLEERTAMANRLGAAVFISIHANANVDHRAHGIETYYLDVTNDKYALRLAAVENKTSGHSVSDLQLILTDLSVKAYTAESAALAAGIQKSMVNHSRARNPHVRDLGVKGSLFYVLLGTRMPSVLLETSFISHKKEGKLLGTKAYQSDLAIGIAGAIEAHLKHQPKGQAL